MGPDELPPWLTRQKSAELSCPIAHIVSMALGQAYISPQWMTSKITWDYRSKTAKPTSIGVYLNIDKFSKPYFMQNTGRLFYPIKSYNKS